MNRQSQAIIAFFMLQICLQLKTAPEHQLLLEYLSLCLSNPAAEPCYELSMRLPHGDFTVNKAYIHSSRFMDGFRRGASVVC